MPRRAIFYIGSDFGPTIAFFVAGQLTDFYTASLTCVIATIFIIGLTYIKERRLALFPLVAAAFIVISGLLTYFFTTPDIIIFADTAYYLLLATTLGGGLIYDRLLLKTLFNDTFAITDTGWRIITLRWCAIFIVAAIINEILRATVTPEQWLTFRFYKIIAISLFGLYQFKIAMRYRIESESNRFGLRS